MVRRDTEGTERTGIVLILVSGVLVMLALLAAVFIQLAGFQEKGQGGRVALAQARIAAECGMEYAAARLTRERADMSAKREPWARGDDWQFRGGGEYRRDPADPLASYPVPERLEESPNPSYSHGENWEDINNSVPGHYEPGDNLAPNAWTDLDGDGRFSAWSGRLRGGKGPLDLKFSLKVEPGASCRINVNGGDLDLPWSGSYYGMGKGTDLRNQEIAMALSAVGVLLDLGAVTTLSTSGTKPVHVSDIGNRLLANRPLLHGYRSMEEMRQVLMGGGPVPLTDGQWRVLEPHLTLVDFDDGVTPEELDKLSIEAMSDLMDLQGASAALLNGYWMYRLVHVRSSWLEYDPAGNLLLAGGVDMDAWSGRNFGLASTFFPEEVGPIIEGIVGRRRQGAIENFDTLYRHVFQAMQANGHGPADIGAGGAATPQERAFWLGAKGDAFMGFVKRSVPPVMYFNGKNIFAPPRSWGNRGLDRDLTVPEVQSDACVTGYSAFDFPLTGSSYTGSEPYDPSGYGGGIVEWPHKAFWFGPVRSFRVASRGSVHGTSGGTAVRTEEGDLQAGIGLYLFSQDHFENVRYRRDQSAALYAPRPRRMAGGTTLHELGRFIGTQSLPEIYPLKSFWTSGSPGYGSIKQGGLTLAEGKRDFPVEPMIAWEFTPDSSLDTDPATMTSGGDHGYGTGIYPFTDNGPDIPKLFNQGDTLHAWGGGSSDSDTNEFIAKSFNPTVGVNYLTPNPGSSGRYFLTSGKYYWLGGNTPPNTIAAPAGVPAPLPMMPHANSLGELIEDLEVMPLNQQDPITQFDYPPDDHQRRWFMEGGVEAWVNQSCASNSTSMTSPMTYWEISGVKGNLLHSVGLAGITDSMGSFRYVLVNKYRLLPMRFWEPIFQEFATVKLETDQAVGYIIWLPTPVRSDPGGGHCDHIHVEWMVRKTVRYDPIDPTGMTHQTGDQMPRVEVDLRVTINGVVAYERLTANGNPEVTTLSYVLDGNNQVDMSQGEPMFTTQIGFIPPLSWAPEIAGIPPNHVTTRENSYLGITFRHCDQIGLHGRFGTSRSQFQDRFHATGLYQSPLLRLPRPATLRWAGWTAAMSEELRALSPVLCMVEGMPGGGGTQTVSAGNLDKPAAWLDMKGVASARFNVEFRIPLDGSVSVPPNPPKVHPDFCDDAVALPGLPPAGTGAFVDPPVFEDFSLFVSSPRWLSRE